MTIDFFIAGVQKSGTTVLDYFLRQHPCIQMAQKKEVHFFDSERTDWIAPDYSRLHRFFTWGEDSVVRGEATPIYTYWPSSLERICCYNPRAKLIIGLRHPSYRAFSHWRMERARNAEILDFAEAISSVGRERVTHAPGGVHRVFSYVERGFYSSQVDRLLVLFPRDQLFFFRTEDFWIETQRVLDEMQTFLKVPLKLKVERQHITPMQTTGSGLMPMAERRFLDQLFAKDIRETAVKTNLALEHWLNPEYREPMAAA